MGELLMNYKEEIIKAMSLLAKDDRVLFLGQTVGYSGSAIFDTLKQIPAEKRIELPIMEDAQLGMCIGLSLEGYIPVSVYPRFDFLLLACNQLVNHLDKYEEMSNGQFKPKVIIRTMVGNKKPLDPGIQHCQDYSSAFHCLLKNVQVQQLYHSESIVPAFMQALADDQSHLFIEYAKLY